MNAPLARPVRGLRQGVHRLDPLAAGSIGGLVAGVVYLLVQLTVSAVAPETDTFAPLYRKAAMLLGGDAATGTTTSGAFGIATLIHFALAVMFGQLIERLARGRSLSATLAIGAATGVGLYLVNFHVIAPSAFPWFAEASGLFTAVNHAIFGALAAGVATTLSAGATGAQSSSDTSP